MAASLQEIKKKKTIINIIYFSKNHEGLEKFVKNGNSNIEIFHIVL
jgi:hypothetical protein